MRVNLVFSRRRMASQLLPNFLRGASVCHCTVKRVYWQALERGCRIAFDDVLSNRRIKRCADNFHGKVGCARGLVGCDDRVAVSENIFRRDMR